MDDNRARFESRAADGGRLTNLDGGGVEADGGSSDSRSRRGPQKGDGKEEWKNGPLHHGFEVDPIPLTPTPCWQVVSR